MPVADPSLTRPLHGGRVGSPFIHGGCYGKGALQEEYWRPSAMQGLRRGI